MANGHELYEAHLVGLLLGKLYKAGYLAVVKAAYENCVQLDICKAGLLRGGYAGEGVVKAAYPGYLMILIGIQSVEAYVQPH